MSLPTTDVEEDPATVARRLNRVYATAAADDDADAAFGLDTPPSDIEQARRRMYQALVSDPGYDPFEDN